MSAHSRILFYLYCCCRIPIQQLSCSFLLLNVYFCFVNHSCTSACMVYNKLDIGFVVLDSSNSTLNQGNCFKMKFCLGIFALVASASCHVVFGQLEDVLTIASTDPNDVSFLLYSNPSNPNDFDELIYNDVSSVSQSRFNANNPLIFLTHGFIQNYTTEFPVYVRDAYLEAGFAWHSNIIVVNWGDLASPKGNVAIPIIGDLLLPVYFQAVGNVKVVGKRLQEFLLFLENNGFLSSGNDVHLVGQSLGAHISGMAGYYYQTATSTLINRITGTDPALPGFEPADINARLDPTDASFVDIVHTNQGEFGYLGTLGHVDFFINGGGPIQLACELANVTDIFCAHNLAPRYFLKSILSNKIMACPRTFLGLPLCTTKNEIVFGEFGSRSARGSYDLNLTL